VGRGDGEEVCDAAVAPAARDLDNLNLTRFDTKSARRARRAARAASGSHQALAVSHQWPVENLVRASAVITRAASSPARTMATAADRFNINSQLEHLQTRYVGTGHADTNRFEWAVNIHRDSYASYFGRHSMLQYFALAENESIGRVRYNMMQVRERERPPPASVA
jgi:splicing factor 3B subunit 5